MTDERAAVRTIFRGQEFVDASDYDALRAENTELSARVSELTRLLGEAEDGICDLVMTCDGMRARFGDHYPCHAANRYDHVRQRLSVQRALQSGEGGGA